MVEFTHLHLHSEYSLLDGACDVTKLVDRVATLGQKSVAMTDHGNIYGAVHFFDAAKARGVKPILGCELYISKKEDHRAPGEGDENNHLLVLAQNEEGYRNLIRITSEASPDASAANCAKNWLPAAMRKPKASLSSMKTSSARAISIWRFRIRALKTKKRFMKRCSAWSASSTFHLWQPTTHITSAAKTAMRTMSCSASKPAPRCVTRSASASIATSSLSKAPT